MTLNPRDWAERQGAFTAAYQANPRAFPHQPVHVRWARMSEEYVRDGRPWFWRRTFLSPTPIRVFVWMAEAPAGSRPTVVVELPPRALPEGQHDADVIAVGQVEMNGAMALLFEDGPHFPRYNPVVPAWTRQRR